LPRGEAAELARAHLRRNQRLVNCITESVLRLDKYDATQNPAAMYFPALIVSLSGVRLKLGVSQQFRVFQLHEGRYSLIVMGYKYSLHDAGDREIIGYHWHPSGQSRHTQPHFHLGPAAETRQRDLASAHLPTGIISLADIIEMAIETFGVDPRTGAWRTVVAEARAAR
jgi:hypothetical protein